MIQYTSTNNKRGIVETGKQNKYEYKPQPSKLAGCLIGLIAMAMVAGAVIYLFTL